MTYINAAPYTQSEVAGCESPAGASPRRQSMAASKFKSILVPVDIAEPETARPAIERAVDLAHASEGSIRLVYLRSILPAGVALPKSRVSAVVHLGSVYNEVVKEANRAQADIIVVGSHRPS